MWARTSVITRGRPLIMLLCYSRRAPRVISHSDGYLATVHCPLLVSTNRLHVVQGARALAWGLGGPWSSSPLSWVNTTGTCRDGRVRFSRRWRPKWRYTHASAAGPSNSDASPRASIMQVSWPSQSSTWQRPGETSAGACATVQLRQARVAVDTSSSVNRPLSRQLDDISSCSGRHAAEQWIDSLFAVYKWWRTVSTDVKSSMVILRIELEAAVMIIHFIEFYCHELSRLCSVQHWRCNW